MELGYKVRAGFVYQHLQTFWVLVPSLLPPAMCTHRKAKLRAVSEHLALSTPSRADPRERVPGLFSHCWQAWPWPYPEPAAVELHPGQLRKVPAVDRVSRVALSPTVCSRSAASRSAAHWEPGGEFLLLFPREGTARQPAPPGRAAGTCHSDAVRLPAHFTASEGTPGYKRLGDEPHHVPRCCLPAWKTGAGAGAAGLSVEMAPTSTRVLPGRSAEETC